MFNSTKPNLNFFYLERTIMASFNISNRKEKPQLVSAMSVKALQSALETCKPKKRSGILKELQKRGVEV